MNYAIKDSQQQALINLLRPQHNAQHMSDNNQNSIKYLLKNLKNKNIISHNNCYISKFKTTKNSPERLIIEKAMNIQKNIDNNNMNYKKSNKFPVKGRIILNNQKKTEKIMEEILKNKIIKNKDKINNKIYENKNNSVNQGTIYKNIKQMNNNNNNKNNNTNITDNINMNLSNYSHILPNKNQYINQNHGGFDFNNLMPGPTTADGPNSYRVPQKRSNSILDDEEYFIYYNKNKKNVNQKNMIDKKLFSTNKITQKSKNDPSFKTIIMHIIFIIVNKTIHS